MIFWKDGNNVLHGVSESGHASLVKLLIDNRADMNCLNDQKLAPIHLAVTNCHIPVIHTFIESGCDMNATDSRNQTALHIAAELGKADIVEMILKAGADLSIQDKANVESNETLQNESPLTFKLDHKTENKQMRSVAWDLAYNQFKPQDWKRLAHNWQFTDSQIAAIEEQWTGPKSYHEHGNRMLLIWLHGTLAANENPGKVLYEGLISIGCKSMAGESHSRITLTEKLQKIPLAYHFNTNILQLNHAPSLWTSLPKDSRDALTELKIYCFINR
ncbi:UNVERIFIED_CONTAM: hypothetical protein FKN15_058867 [Acipenser sinensis]